MKKILAKISILMALTACGGKEIKPTEIIKDATTIKFSQEVFSFGQIPEGDSVAHSFEFTNTGKLPLIITNATASCGCTKPKWPAQPILPNQNGKIDVVFKSTGKKGLQDKVITITANTNPAQTQVHLVGEVLVKNKLAK